MLEQFSSNVTRVLNLSLVNVLFLLVVVWIVGELFERINLPAVLGELLDRACNTWFIRAYRRFGYACEVGNVFSDVLCRT